jgi:antitoxin ParD1/3/4
VLREGVRLVQEREAALAKLHAELDKGVASARQGELHELDDVLDELKARYASTEWKFSPTPRRGAGPGRPSPRPAWRRSPARSAR